MNFQRTPYLTRFQKRITGADGEVWRSPSEMNNALHRHWFGYALLLVGWLTLAAYDQLWIHSTRGLSIYQKAELVAQFPFRILTPAIPVLFWTLFAGYLAHTAILARNAGRQYLLWKIVLVPIYLGICFFTIFHVD